MSEIIRSGRLKAAKRDIVDFISSRKDDEKIFGHIVEINKAHILMLVEQEILDMDVGKKIISALLSIQSLKKLTSKAEDAHMAIEEETIKIIGSEVSGNLNLAKSRNDQVTTAIRMEVRKEVLNLAETIMKMQKGLLVKARDNLNTIIPGYTHLQPAQPTTFAHYLVAQYDTFQRNLDRLFDSYKRVDLCPMGACALATTSFQINREKVANLLGFSEILENSLDAVSSRDYLMECLAVLSMLAMDTTRFIEDIIIWSTQNFGLLEISDDFAFTSSIMPQKKNPDTLEVARARMTRILGNFVSASTILKALPSSYNMDFQESTPLLWNSFIVMRECLEMLSELVTSLKPKPFPKPKNFDFITSTEIANLLVRNYGISFRKSHRIVGTVVRFLLEKGGTLQELTPELMERVSMEILGLPLRIRKSEIEYVLDLNRVVESHNVRGGPASSEVARMIKIRDISILMNKKWILAKKEKINKAKRSFEIQMRSLLKSSTESQHSKA